MAMSDITEFLFGGQAPPNVASSGTSTTTLPQWLQDYTQGLLARSAMVGMEDYQTYGGPRNAALTPDQQSAFGLVRSGIGAGNPHTTAAGQNLNRAAGLSATSNAQPYMDRANTTVPEVIQNYMNPYTENVTNRARDLALRTYNEDILPGINDTFTRAGQFASKGMLGDYTRAGRNTVEGLQTQSNALLADAYQSSAQTAGSDLDRFKGLASLSGDLTTNERSGLIDTASGQNDLAALLQKLNLGDASALEAIGSQQQQQTQRNYDTAYNDFVAQRDYPKDQLEFMRQMLQGLQTNESTVTTDNKPLPGAEYGASGASQITSGLSNLAGIWDLINGWGD